MNKLIIAGNVGDDPVVRYTADGTAIANFSVATSEWRKKAKATEWHSCTAFGKTAETIEKYVTKGSKVVVVGKSLTDEWEKDGQTHKRKVCYVDELQMMDRKEAPKPAANAVVNPVFDDNGGDDIPF